MEEPKVSMGSSGKIDEAGARGIADVDSGMSSSSGMEGSGPESFESTRPYVTTDVVRQDLTLGGTQSL
jgi:hypothetical protein